MYNYWSQIRHKLFQFPHIIIAQKDQNLLNFSQHTTKQPQSCQFIYIYQLGLPPFFKFSNRLYEGNFVVRSIFYFFRCQTKFYVILIYYFNLFYSRFNLSYYYLHFFGLIFYFCLIFNYLNSI